MSVRVIAYYLPQFHPVPENDAWWGKGFTEWTNVTKAKPLFKDHSQPFLPSDLGFYDLRIPEVRQQQADLARANGIDGFCYWHYWFGNGKKVLDLPINQIVKSGKPDFPFCLAWANETWSGRWHGLDKDIIIKQEYLGDRDFEIFFYDCLPAFKDKRYIRVNDKLLFSVYKPFDSPLILDFIKLWRKLAEKESLGGFHFNGINCDVSVLSRGFDSYTPGAPLIQNFHNNDSPINKFTRRCFNKRISDFLRNFPHKGPEIFDYKTLVDSEFNDISDNYIIPVVLSTWDNTPRSGRRGFVIENSSPELFRQILKKAFRSVSSNPQAFQILFIKSWNEWAEGNVLEPSIRYGSSYLKALREVKAEFTKE